MLKPVELEIELFCRGMRLDASAFEGDKPRINRTRAGLGSGLELVIHGDAKDISVPRRTGPITMSGEAYLKHFALPNFFFHVTTTYALLRHNGVELGKADFLGALPQAASA